MTIEEISELLDKKFDEKLAPIHRDIRELKTDVKELKTDVKELKDNMKKVLAFVSVGNEDAIIKLKAHN